MNKTHLRLAALVIGLTTIAACGGGGGGAGMAALGSVFQQAFAQGPNDTPLDISNANLIVDLSQDPFEL
ncbi:hypothetical protein [uncultured Tateyamaria sp.]|uniref:hypothetical protein n=1 Tax=uncultured Tateyamaria sp. TaxID=455651 RepID=UPI002621605A|nr:hypothetical protein [uncultured Tateyamaria sp.]